MAKDQPAIYEFGASGEFRLDVAERLLLRSGKPVALTPKADGRRKEAKDAPAQRTAMSPKHYVHPYSVALVYLAMGEREPALRWLERARTERCWLLIYLRVDPRLDPLRSEPRFQALLKEIRYSS